MKLFNNRKCKICKQRKAVRFCYRIGKRICWHDCNEIRIDYKCTETCKYALLPPKKDQLFQYKTNADSMAEFSDLLKKEIDKWIMIPQKMFQDKIPLQLAETKEGRDRMLSFFSKIDAPAQVPMNYLYGRLKLENLIKKTSVEGPETVAENYLLKIIERDWNGSLEYLAQKELYQKENYLDNYIERHEKNRVFKKMLDIDILSSALSEDKLITLVYFDVNGKFDLTVVLKYIDGIWKVVSKFCGNPELFNGESEAIQQTAVLLSKNQLADTHKLLTQYSSIYPESSDLNYYWGLYYAFSEDNKKAKKYFFSAMVLDNSFLEAKFNYANLLHHEKDYDKALTLYKEIINDNPEDLKVLNNIGAIYLEKKDVKKAKEWFDKCLQIDDNFELAKKNIAKIKAM